MEIRFAGLIVPIAAFSCSVMSPRHAGLDRRKGTGPNESSHWLRGKFGAQKGKLLEGFQALHGTAAWPQSTNLSTIIQPRDTGLCN